MRTLPFLIRKYEAADRARVLDLVNRVFGAAFEHYEPKTEAWWRWKFDSCPGGHWGVVAEDENGQLVGFFPGLVFEVNVEGEPRLFAQTVDTVVDPAFRGGLKKPGLFVRIGQAYVSTNAAPDRAVVTYGLPIPNAYRIGARFIDYWMLRAQSALALRSDAKLPPADPALVVQSVDTFGEDVAALAARTFDRSTCVVRRDTRWMNWRFPTVADDPYRRLQVRHRQSGELLANFVWRDAHFLGRDVVAIVDAIVPPGERAAHAAAIRTMLAWAGERKRDLVTIGAPSSKWFASLIDFGFRIEPTLYAMVARCYADVEPAYLRERWHYTLADLDIL